MTKKTPIILEFNGLPGTGKTTIVNLLKKRLEDKGYKVQKGYAHRIWQRYHYPFLIIPFSFRLYNVICKFSDNIIPYRKRTHQSSVLYYTRAYYKSQKYCKADFMLIDQGIVQDFTTIAWLDKLLPQNKKDLLFALNKIKMMGISFHRIDCVNNLDISMERIKTRPSKNHYFEQLSSEELRDALVVQQHNFSFVRNSCSEVFPEQQIISIDTNLSPEDNVQLLLKEACKLLNKNITKQ